MSFPSTARISASSARRPWRTIGIWVLLLVLGGAAAGMFLSDALTTEIKLLNNPDSAQGETLLKERMGYETPLTETIVVTSDSLTVDDAEFKQVVEGVFGELATMDTQVDQDPSRTINYYDAAASSDPYAAPMPRDPRDPFGREQQGREITRGTPLRNGRHATGQHPVQQRQSQPYSRSRSRSSAR